MRIRKLWKKEIKNGDILLIAVAKNIRWVELNRLHIFIFFSVKSKKKQLILKEIIVYLVKVCLKCELERDKLIQQKLLIF